MAQGRTMVHRAGLWTTGRGCGPRGGAVDHRRGRGPRPPDNSDRPLPFLKGPGGESAWGGAPFLAGDLLIFSAVPFHVPEINPEAPFRSSFSVWLCRCCMFEMQA